MKKGRQKNSLSIYIYILYVHFGIIPLPATVGYEWLWWLVLGDSWQPPVSFSQRKRDTTTHMMRPTFSLFHCEFNRKEHCLENQIGNVNLSSRCEHHPKKITNMRNLFTDEKLRSVLHACFTCCVATVDHMFAAWSFHHGCCTLKHKDTNHSMRVLRWFSCTHASKIFNQLF